MYIPAKKVCVFLSIALSLDSLRFKSKKETFGPEHSWEQNVYCVCSLCN